MKIQCDLMLKTAEMEPSSAYFNKFSLVLSIYFQPCISVRIRLESYHNANKREYFE